MWESFPPPVKFAEAPAHTFWRKVVCVRMLREGVQIIWSFTSPHEDSQEREAVRMCDLWKILPNKLQFDGSYENAHQGKTIQVYHLWRGVQSQCFSQSTRAEVSFLKEQLYISCIY